MIQRNCSIGGYPRRRGTISTFDSVTAKVLIESGTAREIRSEAERQYALTLARSEELLGSLL